jgi:hypothetical protein
MNRNYGFIQAPNYSVFASGIRITTELLRLSDAQDLANRLEAESYSGVFVKYERGN